MLKHAGQQKTIQSVKKKNTEIFKMLLHYKIIHKSHHWKNYLILDLENLIYKHKSSVTLTFMHVYWRVHLFVFLMPFHCVLLQSTDHFQSSRTNRHWPQPELYFWLNRHYPTWDLRLLVSPGVIVVNSKRCRQCKERKQKREYRVSKTTT